MARTRRIDCSVPGLRRIGRGRGFSYVDTGGDPIRDAATLERIRSLAIPPAWKDVWICELPNGHIQATGIDDAGRKQYLYHDDWRAHRDREKFKRMVEFGHALPKLRRRVRRDLKLRGLVRERVLGCAVRLLDLGLFRIGSEQYAEENETYGLATLRKRHLRFEDGVAVFDYRAKNSVRLIREIDDPLVIPTLRALKRRPGRGGLLGFRDSSSWVDARSAHVNEYLKQAVGEDFSAKDFRTWNGTVLAAVTLAAADGKPGMSKAARKRAETEAVKRVASYLGNTPAVCRASYIDPRVIDRFQSGETIRDALTTTVADPDPVALRGRQRIESAVLELIG
jgi:DNA topoisomerase IB